MITHARLRSSFFLVASVVVTAGAVIPPQAAAPITAPSQGETLALARLAEVRSIGRRLDKVNWPGFEVTEYPVVLFQPGGWALAAGFPKAPEGFEKIPGARDHDRPVYRISEPGGFSDPGRSPALVSGRWAVISRFDPPPVIPPEGHMGRPGAEKAIARILGDAFMIHVMEKRGRESPFPSGVPIYPDSAELTALTAVEHRLLLASTRVVNLDEKNFDAFKDLARRIVAVRRERWRIMGPETAALEHAVESTYGLGDLIEQSTHRMATLGGFIMEPISEEDPTYQEHANSLLLRLMMTNYPMSFTPDSPAATVDQIAARARNLGYLVNRITGRLGWKGLEGDYAARVIEGRDALVELLAGGDESETDAAALLEQAKEKQGYLALLRLAREDLIRLIRSREETVGVLFPPGPGRLDIRLAAVEASIANDMKGTIHAGKGRSFHTGELRIRAEGLDLALDEYPLSDRPRVMTLLDPGSRRLEGIAIRLDGLAVSVAGRPLEPGFSPASLEPGSPLVVDGHGIRLEARAGTLSAGGDGGLLLAFR